MSSAGRVARNTLANWAGTATSSLVILFLTPYVLHVLGDERFGVFAVAQQALVYVNLLTLGMRESVTRFACKEIAADNVAGLNVTLSTVSVLYLVVGVVGMVVCGVLGLLAPAFFGIEPCYAAETSVLFSAMGVNFLLALFAFAYGGVLVGHQRYDLLNLGNIIRELCRAGLVVLIFTLGWRTLGGFAAALVSAYVAALAYFWYAGHRQQPNLRLSLRRASGGVARQILGFGAWNALVQIGNVITFATPTIIVAKMLGPEQVVFFAIPFLLADRLRLLVAGMANTLTPIAAATLVTGDREQFRTLIVKGTRAAATLCFPAGAILLVLCEPFLRLWMGPEYAWSWVVYAIVMIAMFGRIAQAPTLWILIGGGRIRGLAYVQMAAAVATIVLTIALVQGTSLGVPAVAIGITVPLFLSHTLYLPWYAARQMNVPVTRYYRESYLWPALSALSGAGAAFTLSRLWPPVGWPTLIVEFMVPLGVSAAVAWPTCLEQSVRERVLGTLRIR